MDKMDHSLYAYYRNSPTDTLMSCLGWAKQNMEFTKKKIDMLTEILTDRGVDMSSVDFAGMPLEREPQFCHSLNSLIPDHVKIPASHK